MSGYESWTIKKAEHWRIDAFELWCWRRFLRVPWTARRYNQAILKEISPEYSFGTTDAEAATPILWPPDAKKWVTGKDPDPGKDWGQEEKWAAKVEMASSTQWTWVWVNSGSWWWTGRPGVLQSMGSQRVKHDWATELKLKPVQETWETWVWFLGQEDPLEEEMATHSNILAWRIPWTEEPVGLWSIGSQRVRHNWSDFAHTQGFCITH